MVPGTDVVITDDTDTIIAKGKLGTGTIPDAGGPNSFTCRWGLVITIPDAPFYTVTVGDQKVGTLSRDEMAANNWSPTLDVN